MVEGGVGTVAQGPAASVWDEVSDDVATHNLKLATRSTPTVDAVAPAADGEDMSGGAEDVPQRRLKVEADEEEGRLDRFSESATRTEESEVAGGDILRVRRAQSDMTDGWNVSLDSSMTACDDGSMKSMRVQRSHSDALDLSSAKWERGMIEKKAHDSMEQTVSYSDFQAVTAVGIYLCTHIVVCVWCVCARACALCVCACVCVYWDS